MIEKIGPMSSREDLIALNLGHPRIFFAINGLVIYKSLSAFVLVGFYNYSLMSIRLVSRDVRSRRLQVWQRRKAALFLKKQL